MTVAAIGLALALSAFSDDADPQTSTGGDVVVASMVQPREALALERGHDVALMLADINATRIANGLRRLVLDTRLCRVAITHAIDMVSRRYFGHDSPDGETPFDRMRDAHVPFGWAGENLALDRNEPSAAQALWNSPEHRSNILQSHYARVGIAAVATPQGEIFVEDFSD